MNKLSGLYDTNDSEHVAFGASKCALINLDFLLFASNQNIQI
jgi:hypothetical protein